MSKEIAPKEKANDLVNEFRIILMDEDTDCGQEILCSLIAIKHSKIVVREIITELNKLPSKDLSDLQYWGEVEHELNEL